jgi:4-amino-4-deoxy-L-arabinose transferase-like glycosyltransferase
MAPRWVGGNATAATTEDARKDEGQGAGPRAVWLTVGIIGALFAVLIGWQMLKPRPFFTGTDSVGVGSIVANVAPGQELCVPGLELPAATGGVRLAVFSPASTVAAKVIVHVGGSVSSAVSSAPTVGSRANLQAVIPTTPTRPASRTATVCMAPLSGPLGVGGSGNLQYGEVRPEIGPAGFLSHPSGSIAAKSRAAAVTNPPGRISVWFLPPHGEERSLLASLGTIFSRAALFRPGFVGPWTYPVLLFLVLPLTWILSLLALLRAAAGRELRLRGRRVRLGLIIGVIAFANAASWALITPAFNTPDEPDHFAYVQYLAETGHTPSKVSTAQAAFSTEQVLAMNAVDTYGVISNSEARPPWLKSDERSAAKLRVLIGVHPKNNGGGYTPAAASHDPPYYALGALAYLLVRGESVFTQLTAVRLVSALLGAIVAMCAFGIVRELVPRYRLAAVAAGLLVAYHPMFGFISAAVNDDSGVNAAAAVTLYMLVRSLRRGLHWPEALALGVALAVAPLMKETGFEIYPAAAVGIAGLLWRDLRGRSRKPDGAAGARPGIVGRLSAWGALAVGFVVPLVAWAVIKPHVLDVGPTGRPVAGNGFSATDSLSLAEHMPGRFLSYLWQLFLPPLSFMGRLFPPGWPFFQIYVERGWASFGWYTFDFTHWVYVVIVLAMGVVGALSLLAAWRYRRVAKRLGWELLTIVLFPLCTLVAVEAAFFTPTGGRVVVAEQGRYIFPAIGALAAIAIGGTFGLGRRWQVPLATGLVVAMVGLSYASQLLTLGSFYT